MAANANIAQVCVEGDLDVRAVPQVKRWVDGLIDGGCRRIVLNMAKATYADSAGLGLILSELRHMREVGGLLSLTNVSDRVYQSLLLMRMLDFVPISRAGASEEVPELPAGELPRWRTTFRVDAKHLDDARTRLERLLDGLPFTRNDVFDMNLASGEAVGNAVDHTSACGVLVTVAAYADRVVVDVAEVPLKLLVNRDVGSPLQRLEGGEQGKHRAMELDHLALEEVDPLGRVAAPAEDLVVRLVKLYSDPKPGVRAEAS